jgi:hypothetical protein
LRSESRVRTSSGSAGASSCGPQCFCVRITPEEDRIPSHSESDRRARGRKFRVGGRCRSSSRSSEDGPFRCCAAAKTVLFAAVSRAVRSRPCSSEPVRLRAALHDLYSIFFCARSLQHLSFYTIFRASFFLHDLGSLFQTTVPFSGLSKSTERTVAVSCGLHDRFTRSVYTIVTALTAPHTRAAPDGDRTSAALITEPILRRRRKIRSILRRRPKTKPIFTALP